MLSIGDRFGVSVTSLGDLDGDGVADLAVGAHRDNNNRGAVWILFLNPLATTCTLELTPSYADGTLTVDVLAGATAPTTINLWATSQSNVIPIIAGQPMPVTDPPTTHSIIRPVPPMGTIGMLATLTTPEDNIICSDFQTVNTGSAP